MAGGKVSRPREAVLLCVFAETTPTTTPDVSRNRGRLSAAGAACSVLVQSVVARSRVD